jgi:hypothetical protein
MQWIMSNKLCEAPRIRQIRSRCRGLPRWSAYLWSGMVKPRSCEVESVFEVSRQFATSKRQYGVEIEGNPTISLSRMKSTVFHGANTSGYMGYKSCASVGGATSEKMGGQIHKTSHPELGCSGDLNLTDTVRPVNVGTSHLGRKTGLAATEVRCEGREIRSSLSQIRSGTWRRNLASCSPYGSRENVR